MIETQRLFIKPLTAEELKKHLDSPSGLARELGFIPSQSPMDEETKDAIRSHLLPHIEDTTKDMHFYTMWIIVEKAEKAIVGGICFHGEPDESGEVEIGYGMDEAYRNKGYMTETIAGLIRWIGQNTGVRSIIANTGSTNLSSVNVLEKNGFKRIQQHDDTLLLRLKIG